MSKESMIATILTRKCRERRNLGIIQPDKNPDSVFGSDQELRTMPTSSEHKTVQTRILAYAQEIGWTIVTREEAEQRRGFDPDVPPADRARNRSLFFADLLDANPPSPRGYGVAGVREFNPRYAEAEGALLGQFPPSSSTTAGPAGANFSTTRRSLSAT